VVGDPTQIHGVSAGDFFRVITDLFESQTAKIEKIIRQKPEALNGHYLTLPNTPVIRILLCFAFRPHPSQ
jgi:hypothetical protein